MLSTVQSDTVILHATVIASPHLVVIQVEIDLYTLLKKPGIEPTTSRVAVGKTIKQLRPIPAFTVLFCLVAINVKILSSSRGLNPRPPEWLLEVTLFHYMANKRLASYGSIRIAVPMEICSSGERERERERERESEIVVHVIGMSRQYVPVFLAVRWHHVVNDLTSLRMIENEKILPHMCSWLEPMFLYGWRRVLAEMYGKGAEGLAKARQVTYNVSFVSVDSPFEL
ncbi:hypothetical protein DPMN_025183 [Dreissena polymorpha]|uniref:Uncharacterized protein n=1 Tax=Dreissena polymorpha TaxID=45954 RepID=A0A9D4RD36_DREPO|nr:hypothetical protein DPMN_025183 [Dreissena polymorpha]